MTHGASIIENALLPLGQLTEEDAVRRTFPENSEILTKENCWNYYEKCPKKRSLRKF